MKTAATPTFTCINTDANSAIICQRALDKYDRCLRRLNIAWKPCCNRVSFCNQQPTIKEIEGERMEAWIYLELLWSCGHLTPETYTEAYRLINRAKDGALERRTQSAIRKSGT